jgi:hypothetical protein
MPDDQLVVAHGQPADEPQQRAPIGRGPEGGRDIGAVPLDDDRVQVDPGPDIDPHQRVAAADHVVPGRHDGDAELATALLDVLLGPAEPRLAGAGADGPRRRRQQPEARHHGGGGQRPDPVRPGTTTRSGSRRARHRILPLDGGRGLHAPHRP